MGDWRGEGLGDCLGCARNIPLRVLTLASACAIAGCGAATPEAKYGTVARYSPHHGGYVVTTSWLEAPPTDNADVLVLREPLTEAKLRCREQILAWLPSTARGAGERVRDEYDANRSLVMLLPVAAPGFVLAGGAAILATASVPFLGAAELPHLLSGQPSATTFYERGVAAFRAGRYAEAEQDLLTAIAMDPPRAQSSYGLYYVGLSFEQERRPDLAARSLTAFVERAAVVDAGTYRNAESALNRLGAPLPPCSSQDPVSIAWTR